MLNSFWRCGRNTTSAFRRRKSSKCSKKWILTTTTSAPAHIRCSRVRRETTTSWSATPCAPKPHRLPPQDPADKKSANEPLTHPRRIVSGGFYCPNNGPARGRYFCLESLSCVFDNLDGFIYAEETLHLSRTRLLQIFVVIEVEFNLFNCALW